MPIDKTTAKLLQHPVLKKHLPYKNNFIEINGQMLHYLDEGNDISQSEKPVIVMLHGNPTWCFFYRRLIEHLKDKFRLIAPDFIGLGLSSHPTNIHYRAADRIDQVEFLLNNLEIKKYSLIMHDWGGSIGSALALRDLNRVDRLIYLNTTLTETEALPAFIKTAAMPIIGKYVTKNSTRFLKFLTGLGVQKKLTKDVKKGFFLPYKSKERRTAIWDFVADIPFDERHASYQDMLDLAEGLPELAKKPIQIVWGLKDPCFHREMLNKVSEHFPDAEVHELANASHLLLEDAFEEAATYIKGFLTKSNSEIVNGTGNQKLVDLNDTQGVYPFVKKYASEHPDELATIIPSFLGDNVKYAQASYRKLMTLVNKYQRGLQDLGLSAGDKVVMLVTPGLDFLALSIAIMGRAAIPCFLDPGMGKEKLIKCIEDLKPQAIIGSPKVQLLRFFYPRLFKNLKFNLVASDWLYFFGPNLGFLKKFSAKPLPERKSSGTAMLAYTSGATGTPKAVVFTDSMVAAQLGIFKNLFGMQAGKKDLPLLPIFSLFNVGIGVCSVFSPIDPSKPIKLNPAKIVQICKDLGVEYSFGSPTLWRKIAEYCVRSGQRLDSIEKIFIAGTAVEENLIELLQSIQSGIVSTPYGSTEALPVTLAPGMDLLNHNPEKSLTGEQGICVGKVLDDVGLKICPIQDAPITETDFRECKAYEIGEILVSGKNVSTEYYSNSKATANAKIKIANQIWHRMGDVGYLDSDGYLYFCGRKNDIVTTIDRTYYSVPCESVFNKHPKIARTALVNLNSGESAAIVVEPIPKYWPEDQTSRDSFIKELKQLALDNPVTKDLSVFLFHESFPVDGRHNAKIFRDQLSIWASELNNKNKKIAC